MSRWEHDRGVAGRHVCARISPASGRCPLISQSAFRSRGSSCE